MIRLGVRVVEDITRALLKIKESDEYKEFLQQYKIITQVRSCEVTRQESECFKRLRRKIEIRVYEQTEAILYRLVEKFRSKKKKNFYVKRSIRPYQRFISVLKSKVHEILPELFNDFVFEIDEAERFFRFYRVL